MTAPKIGMSRFFISTGRSSLPADSSLSAWPMIVVLMSAPICPLSGNIQQILKSVSSEVRMGHVLGQVIVGDGRSDRRW